MILLNQICGAFLGAIAAWLIWISGRADPDKETLRVFVIQQGTMTVAGGFFAEAIGATILCTVMLLITDKKSTKNKNQTYGLLKVASTVVLISVVLIFQTRIFYFFQHYSMLSWVGFAGICK